MKKFLSFLLLSGALILSGSSLAQGTTEDPVILEVGATSVTLSELNDRFRVFVGNIAVQQRLPLTEDILAEFEPLKGRFLEQLATDMVLLQEAQKRGLGIDEAEVDSRFEEVRAQVPEGGDFAALLLSAGFKDIETLRRFIRETTERGLLMQQLQSEIDVNENDARAWYEANKSQFPSEGQVCARHILVETEEEANAIYDELVTGADFATTAQEKSTGPSGPNGGNLGCFGRGAMVPPFEEAAFAAQVGMSTQPVKTQFGFHLIQTYTPAFEDLGSQALQGATDEKLGKVIEALYDASGVVTYADRLQ